MSFHMSKSALFHDLKQSSEYFCLILDLNMVNSVLYSNCKLWTIFSLTKHDASVVVPYFLLSYRRKMAISLK